MSSRVVLATFVAVLLFAAGVYGLVQIYRAPLVGTAAPAASAAGPVLASSTTELGTFVTRDGFTLYRFDKDTAKPSKSNCVDKCATTWPPVIVDGAKPAIQGVSPAAVGTVARADGTTQLTIGNWPVYRFSADKAAGDTAGEGVSGTWFAVGVDGKKASATKPSGFASSTTALGTIVAQQGFTLYRFDKDTAKPSASNCAGKCAVTWPPVIVKGAKPVIQGVDAAAVGTVSRADGTTQLTIGNWPVYRYSGDKAAGDTAGQGVGGTWFAVAPDGKKVAAAAASQPGY